MAGLPIVSSQHPLDRGRGPPARQGRKDPGPRRRRLIPGGSATAVLRARSGRPVCPGRQGALLRHLPGHAVRDDRIRPLHRRLKGANSTEFDADARIRFSSSGGSCGACRTWAATCAWGSTSAGSRRLPGLRSYRSTEIYERHRHRFEFNPEYEKPLSEAGLFISGKNPITDWSRSWRFPAIPGSWAASSIRNSNPGRSSRTRFSLVHRSFLCPSLKKKGKSDRPGLLGGPAGLFLIAGPCVIESRRQALFLAAR